MNTQNALKELIDGNNRFISNKTKTRTQKPEALAKGQSPFAIIITCADSRVPPELIFDQDLGELFVIRVAGNTPTDEVIGSAEYAAANLGSSLCIVLGHTNCGAVAATIDRVVNNATLPSSCLCKLTEPIIKPVKKAVRESSSEKLLDTAIDFNVINTVESLLKNSDIISNLTSNEKLRVCGAKYHLDTGKVEFFE